MAKRKKHRLESGKQQMHSWLIGNRVHEGNIGALGVAGRIKPRRGRHLGLYLRVSELATLKIEIGLVKGEGKLKGFGIELGFSKVPIQMKLTCISQNPYKRPSPERKPKLF